MNFQIMVFEILFLNTFGGKWHFAFQLNNEMIEKNKDVLNIWNTAEKLLLLRPY